MSDITIVDIAKQAGVSIKTVSRVINREEGVGPATRARVEDLIEKLGYRPNVSARSLSSRRSYLIGVVFMRVGAYHYVGEVQVGAMRACRRAGYHMVIEQVDDPGQARGPGLAQALKAGRFDGLVLTPPVCDDPEILAIIEAQGLAYVRVAPDRDFGRSPYVFMDDQQAAHDVTARLWDLGHRRIGFIDGPADHGSARRRREGYMTAMAERGQRVKPEWIAPGDFMPLSGLEAGDRLLGLPEPPTAIFAANDDMAAGVIRIAAERGLSVPRDLSVCGFDDTPISRHIYPALTTIRQPTSEMGRLATLELLARIKSPGAGRMLRVDHAVLMRESTQAPRRR